MSKYIILAISTAIAGGLIYWGIKSGNLKRVLLGIGSFFIGAFAFLFKLNLDRKDKIKDLESEVKAKDKQLNRQKEVVKIHSDKIDNVNEVKTSSDKKKSEQKDKIDKAKQNEKPVEASIDVGNDFINDFNRM